VTAKVLHGDCRDELRALEENSVHCFVTSPPYYGLRDYKIPPSIWGGDSTCQHDFEPEEVATEIGRGNWAQGVNGRGEEQPGGVDAKREPIRGKVERGFCRHCGAWKGVLGLEPGWALYIEHVVEVFREVHRVLRKDGTLWLNIGDSYASATAKGNSGYGTSTLTNGGAYQEEVPRPWSGRPELGGTSMKRTRAYRDGSHAGKHSAMTGRKGSNRAQRGDGNEGIPFGPMSQPNRTPQAGFKPKDRMMIPARVAIALCDDGWWLRDEIIWRKPNPMPSSAEDRTTPAHEMLYMLSKSQRYFYDNDAIAEPANYPPGSGWVEEAKGERDGKRTDVADDVLVERSFRAIRETRNKRSVWPAEPVEGLFGEEPPPKTPPRFASHPRGKKLVTPKSAPNDSNVRAKESWHASTGALVETRNKRSVWDIATFSFPEAHFATFPPDLVEPCILAGTSARGCCVVCRTPWERVTAEVETGATQKMPAGHATKAGSHSPVDHNAEGRELAPGNNPVMATVTLGFYPVCRCAGAPELPDHPPKPSRARSASEAAYKIAMNAWRGYAAAVDIERERLCKLQLKTPTVPAVVGDPFGGSGTVGMVADRMQRDALLIDLGKDYVEMARRRINQDCPLFGGADDAPRFGAAE